MLIGGGISFQGSFAGIVQPLGTIGPYGSWITPIARL